MHRLRTIKVRETGAALEAADVTQMNKKKLLHAQGRAKVPRASPPFRATPSGASGTSPN